MSVFDGHHNISAIISSSGVPPSGCPMLYYMLDALLFPQPQPAPDGERSIHFQTLTFPVKGAYLTENINQAATHTKVPNTDNQSMLWTEPTVLNTVNNFPPLIVWTLH